MLSHSKRCQIKSRPQSNSFYFINSINNKVELFVILEINIYLIDFFLPFLTIEFNVNNKYLYYYIDRMNVELRTTDILELVVWWYGWWVTEECVLGFGSYCDIVESQWIGLGAECLVQIQVIFIYSKNTKKKINAIIRVFPNFF